MNEQEVKQKIGLQNWERFCQFMQGQTVEIKGDTLDYYEYDVQQFIRINES